MTREEEEGVAWKGQSDRQKGGWAGTSLVQSLDMVFAIECDTKEDDRE